MAFTNSGDPQEACSLLIGRRTCSATSSRFSAVRCIRTVSSSSMASSLACPLKDPSPAAGAVDLNSLKAHATRVSVAQGRMTQAKKTATFRRWELKRKAHRSRAFPARQSFDIEIGEYLNVARAKTHQSLSKWRLVLTAKYYTVATTTTVKRRRSSVLQPYANSKDTDKRCQHKH